MLTTDFKKMKDEEKQIVITRLSTRVDTTETVLMNVLLQMNPALSIENNKVWMSRFTLERLHKKIREYER
ncbi:hypothetical protein [Aquimarina pacifica]|uniref:hypothetical protein n=1 Tax=Aquimarina pacifica TaxID=1296415 RepID=UPI00046F2BDA|nr:hypothetical protein [Aquimarina pacifica]